MNSLDDDRNESYTLPAWATLTEASTALAFSRNAIKSAARRAIKQQEPWVKKEDGKILLDTRHEAFWCHVKRWQEQKEYPATDQADGDGFAPAQSLKDMNIPGYQWYPSLATLGDRHWPAFCLWLAELGLQVFFNLLEDETAPVLQWRWGDLHGEGRYEDLKEAVIAACHSKLSTSQVREAEPIFSTDFPPHKAEPERFWPFGKDKRTPSIDQRT